MKSNLLAKQAAIVAAITNGQVTNWTVTHRNVLIAIREGKPTPNETTESILEDVMRLIQAIPEKCPACEEEKKNSMLPTDPITEPADPFNIPERDTRS